MSSQHDTQSESKEPPIHDLPSRGVSNTKTAAENQEALIDYYSNRRGSALDAQGLFDRLQDIRRDGNKLARQTGVVENVASSAVLSAVALEEIARLREEARTRQTAEFASHLEMKIRNVDLVFSTRMSNSVESGGAVCIGKGKEPNDHALKGKGDGARNDEGRRKSRALGTSVTLDSPLPEGHLVFGEAAEQSKLHEPPYEPRLEGGFRAERQDTLDQTSNVVQQAPAEALAATRWLGQGMPEDSMPEHLRRISTDDDSLHHQVYNPTATLSRQDDSPAQCGIVFNTEVWNSSSTRVSRFRECFDSDPEQPLLEPLELEDGGDRIPPSPPKREVSPGDGHQTPSEPGAETEASSPSSGETKASKPEDCSEEKHPKKRRRSLEKLLKGAVEAVKKRLSR
ncbi:hypothetical protein BJ170DRAFT_678559 [Xylariales sp. AK1849]|nr:hypothetical protein BJ170DRAFT_678559 [Xylariales sp. AK1849]